MEEDLDDKKLKFLIPSRYSFTEDTRLICEIPQFDGSFFNIYENLIFEYRLKNESIHKLFDDGTIISIFPNKDIRIIYPNGDAFYKFRAVGILEFIYYEKNYSIIKYKNAEIEKVMKNGMRIIKSPYSNEVKIIDLNNYEYKKNHKDSDFIITEIKIKRQNH